MREFLDRLTAHAWFAYPMLLLLQLKVLWGIQYRDLAIGDESSYYNRAFLWVRDFSVDIVWSPLYTAFLGTLMRFTTDAFVVTTLHRVIVVLALDVMVLALMRRVLPPWIAWLAAAWWVVLPIVYDTVSTVHLFTAIPVVAAWLIIMSWRTPWARGGAIALLAVTTVLVRNEYIVATIALAGVCLWWETRSPDLTRESTHRPASYVLGYGVPLVLAVAVIVFFYARTIYQFPELWTGTTLPRYQAPWSAHSGLSPKHTYNMCQVYAVGYQQRHPEWDGNPMLECPRLMLSTFGTEKPSLLEMLRRNLGAVMQHFWWNVMLTPSGIQLLLFNASAGAVNPDYFPVELRSTRALALSIVTAGVVLYGLFLLYRERRFWWQHWLKDRALGWLAILCVLLVAVVIIPTQRPRPSYLFVQGLAIIALTGLCVFAISRRWPVLGRLSATLPIVMLLLPLVVPHHYPTEAGPRPLLVLYERLAPFSAAFHRPDTIFLVSGYPLEVHGYVGRNYFTSPLIDFDYAVLAGEGAGQPFVSFLEQHGINLVYIDEPLWNRLSVNPTDRSFLSSPESAGWKVLVSRETGAGHWMLLQKN
jgi:hypothetical protein